MEDLQKKIDQWFIKHDVPVESRHTELNYGVLKALWSTIHQSHVIDIEFDDEDTYQPELSSYQLVLLGDTLLKNQTEENIFQLLNCLLNHIK